jgi:hypothetical protein
VIRKRERTFYHKVYFCHNHFIAPILIATNAKNITPVISLTPQNDKVLFPEKLEKANEMLKKIGLPSHLEVRIDAIGDSLAEKLKEYQVFDFE